ncbi:MAG: hypothetical protein J6Y89_00725 [Lachnospiraceae bacterium]|nr:hypothetical protein [Lachnospiraceae bacterium]
MSKVKMIVQWLLVAFFGLCALGWMPTLTSAIFILGAVILMPIKPIEDFMQKLKLKLVARVVIAVILMAVAFSVAPDKAPATARKEQRENAASSSDTQNSADDKKNSSDNNKSSSDDKKDNKKADNSEIKAQISGTWHYGGSVAIDMYYTFYEDGKFEMESENDSKNSGTYEIVDGKMIEMKGSKEDRTFTIKNSEKLADEEGRELTRYASDND